MAKRKLSGEQRHRVGLSLQRLIRASEELREAQVDLISELASVSRVESSYWIRTLAIFADGSLESEARCNQLILSCLRSAELRPRDIVPKCDLRPCTDQQREAIERLGKARRKLTYSQAEDVIREAQTRKASDDKRARDSKVDEGRRVTVHAVR